MLKNNIKVGDYVRTECGIAKIKNFETKNKEVIELDKDIMICNMDCYRNNCTINQVIKSSPNIIDLIEVGDYVNGKKVTKINLDKTMNGETAILCGDSNYDCLDVIYKNCDIKSIVTKEQMETMEYKIDR